MSRFDFDTASETLTNDVLLAVGALSATGNELLIAVAQGIHDARPLLAGLIALGRKYESELESLVEAARVTAEVTASKARALK